MGRFAEPPIDLPFLQRLRTEWDILRELAAGNPDRLTEVRVEDTIFRLTLRSTPALPPCSKTIERGEVGGDVLVTEHALRIEFPVYFPAAPMELYLQTPMQHPNIDPDTGFVCLWERHRVSNTVEHALHKTVAILGWQLQNSEPMHVMQPAALARLGTEGDMIRRRLEAPALRGTARRDDYAPVPDSRRKRVGRLS